MPVLGGGVYSSVSHLDTPCRSVFIVTSRLSDTESSNRFSLNQSIGERLCLMLESARRPELPQLLGYHIVRLSWIDVGQRHGNDPVVDRQKMRDILPAAVACLIVGG